jgi:hypothetical protein
LLLVAILPCKTKQGNDMKTVSKVELLNQFENRIEQHLKTATSSFQNLNAHELLKPAANGGWSIAQCLEHLNSYGRYYLPAIQKGIQSAEDVMVPAFKSSWLGSYFTRMMEPGVKTRALKSPKEHQPSAQLNPEKVIADFIEQQELLLSLVRTSMRKDINRIRIPISIAQWLKLKLGDVFGFIIAHNERHIQQALRHLQ